MYWENVYLLKAVNDRWTIRFRIMDGRGHRSEDRVILCQDDFDLGMHHCQLELIKELKDYGFAPNSQMAIKTKILMRHYFDKIEPTLNL